MSQFSAKSKNKNKGSRTLNMICLLVGASLGIIFGLMAVIIALQVLGGLLIGISNLINWIFAIAAMAFLFILIRYNNPISYFFFGFWGGAFANGLMNSEMVIEFAGFSTRALQSVIVAAGLFTLAIFISILYFRARYNVVQRGRGGG